MRWSLGAWLMLVVRPALESGNGTVFAPSPGPRYTFGLKIAARLAEEGEIGFGCACINAVSCYACYN
jgi:hypothetical protein